MNTSIKGKAVRSLGVLMMKTDTEIKMQGLEILYNHLGVVETERFVALIQKERFAYTKWRQNLFQGMSGKQISTKATEFQKKLREDNVPTQSVGTIDKEVIHDDS